MCVCAWFNCRWSLSGKQKREHRVSAKHEQIQAAAYVVHTCKHTERYVSVRVDGHTLFGPLGAGRHDNEGQMWFSHVTGVVWHQQDAGVAGKKVFSWQRHVKSCAQVEFKWGITMTEYD